MEYEFVNADYKDFQGFIEELKEKLKTFGLHTYDDISLEGSDTLGIIISDTELEQDQVDKLSNDVYDNE